MPLTCADLLTQNYLEWQKSQGELRKLKDFADFLGIHEVTLNQLINGRKQATTKMLVNLAQKTGDVRFYDLADLPHPDPSLQTLTRLWSSLDEEARQSILEQAEKYAESNEQASGIRRPVEKTS